MMLFTFFFLLPCRDAFSQNDSASQTLTYDPSQINYDSATSRVLEQIKQFGDSQHKKNIRRFTEDSIATRQDATMGLIKSLILEVQAYLENGIDTSGLDRELTQIEKWYAITSDGVFVNTGTIQTHRNLETSYKIMRELLIRVLARKSSLDDYYGTLIQYRNTLDSFYKEDALYRFSDDSAVLMRYVERLTIALHETKPVDSILKRTLVTVAELQPAVNLLVNKLNASIAHIEIFQGSLSSKAFNRELKNLGGPVAFHRPFKEIVNFSMSKAVLAFVFYVNNVKGKITMVLLLVIACAIFLTGLKRKIQASNMTGHSHPAHAVLKYPLLSALAVILNICQFIFLDPPFPFSALIWVLSGLSLTFILKDAVNRYWLICWLILFVLFLFACLDNLFLQASRTERWTMLGLSVAGIISGVTIISKASVKKPAEKLLIYFIGLVIIMQVISILANAYGRYNLSKTCLTAGYFNVVLAILFFWTLRLINQGFSLASLVYVKNDRKIQEIDFDRSPPVLFYVLLFVGWFVLFARNFYASKLISEPLKNLIVEKRTFGDISLSIGNLLEFFLIIYLSALLSRLVAFFASDKSGERPTMVRKRLGSWLLVIRISIISIGLLAAFAAIGIPMDRLTIMLSALSVGIGFGLQGLVNNLVSGLIITFEQPVSVGDTIEIGGKLGTIQSIGFRSSIITTTEGAAVVVPNGDLLNQHLINWTHGNPSRSVDIPVSVATGTDLDKVMAALKELPGTDERVLLHPAPSVIIRQFNLKSIELQLTFWVGNIRNLPAVKSDIILAIDHVFKENSINLASS